MPCYGRAARIHGASGHREVRAVARHEFEPAVFLSTIGSHPPVLRIEPGDTVVTSTVDAAGRDAHGSLVATPGNPQTGPFFIGGAQPGDMLEVHFDKIWPNRDRAWASASIAPHVLDPAYLRDQPVTVGAMGSVRLGLTAVGALVRMGLSGS